MYSLYNYIEITQTITQLNLIKPVSLTFSLVFSPIYQIYILVSLACAIEVQNSNENDEFLVDDVLVHPNAFDSDHHPLTFKLHVKKTRPRNAQRKVYCYRSGDFNGLRESLGTLPWDLVTSDTSIDTSLDKFQDMLFCAIDHHIPQRTLKRRSRPPWIDNEIMKLIRKKKKLWKRLRTNGSDDLFLKFKDLSPRTRKFGSNTHLRRISETSPT